ncbi:MAG: HDOD domain-containing protein [Polaromonas sp.]|uniref:EAL and HDOD domain-containing protein n=1 Tax=Polaromonas sp. TaxID=1869339 RepID=UPI00248A2D62|nr:HDOD domain-containing protein [Polaromonas sp.]MDI1239435.1 HDOD domain-containing protein [Polaromonas sp.]
MFETKYLVRAPLLDPRQNVLGYKLGWQKKENGAALSREADLRQLLAFVGEHAAERLGLLYVEAVPGLLTADALKSVSPATTVLVLQQDALLDSGHMTLVVSLIEQGYAVALQDADLARLAASPALLSIVTQVEVAHDHPDLAAISRLSQISASSFSVLVRRFPGWREFDACASLGLNGFFPNLCMAARESNPRGELGPQAALILKLMKMVQDNADVRELEKVLKHDATISYKLFRYINSAGFGIEVEIESLRLAVAMLGYRPLFRWLSLLLAATSSTGFSPALMQAAIVRGHFAELLGRGALPKSEAENLFFVGMFSLLDRLLGIPMQEVMSRILLPEPVVQALLAREGPYGPFLALVEACEQEDGCAALYADALFMTAADVNQAHVSALAWAQNIKL